MAREQVFLANGEQLEGVALERDDFDEHAGYMHGTVHIWVWRKFEERVQVLLQKRSLAKKTFPGMLDISAAGHIDKDEKNIDAAVREASEEIDLQIARDSLLFVARIRKTNVKNGISTVYLYEVNKSFVPSFNDGEVESCDWFDIDDLIKIFESPDEYNFANHGKAYFMLLLEHIKSL